MATITQGLDEGKVKAFIQRMVTHLTGASIGLMLEVGRQTGLFETLAVMAPATSSAIAERAGLIERYVREWLGAMVCGGIVEYEPAAQTYRLPPEHALLLTGSSSRNLVTLGAMFPLLMRVVPDVVKAFRKGGGVPYAAYEPDFAGLMEVEAGRATTSFSSASIWGQSRGSSHGSKRASVWVTSDAVRDMPST